MEAGLTSAPPKDGKIASKCSRSFAVSRLRSTFAVFSLVPLWALFLTSSETRR